ncbi:MAG: oligosaccharide flippase family protein [Acidobacteriota bacterium]
MSKQKTTHKNNERQNADWDLRYAFRNYSTLVVTQIVSAFFSFASVWLATRYLGTEGYGGIVVVIAASQVAQIFVNWTCVALARFGVEEFVEDGNINKSFWARSLIFLPNTLVFLAFSFLWLPIISNWLKLPPEAWWFVVGHFIASSIWLHVQHSIQGAKLPRLQGVLLAIERILIFSALLILALSGKIDYLSAIAAYIFAPFLMTFVGLFELRKLVSWRIEIDKALLKKMIKFSVPLIPFSLIGYFSTSYLDVFFISQYLSKTDVGIYSIAYQVSGIAMQIPVLAGSILLPMFVTMQSKTDHDNQINVYFTKILPSICFAWTFVCALIATFGGLALPLIFGEKVSDIHILLWIMMATAGISGPVLWGYGVMSNAKSLTYISTIYAIVIASLNVLFNYLLIPRFGLIGCAWASVIANFFGTLVVVIILNKSLQIKKIGAILAVSPILIGAYFATIYNNAFLALTFTIIAGFLYFLFNRKVIFEVFIIFRKRTFSQFNNGKAGTDL